MIVTGIEEITPKLYKVYIDDEFAFAISKSELSRYSIEVDSEIDESNVSAINEMLLKRAKKYVLNLLGKMDRTREEIINKLKKYNYREDIITEAIAYADKFGYIDDERYAINIVSTKKRYKSPLEIRMILKNKGFDDEIIDRSIESEYSEEDEYNTIRKLIDKKHFSYNEDKVKEQKVIAYLVRKGFGLSKVRRVIQQER
ncbi:MAG: regulatory protein RecX [Suipraeoptans sp.]